MPIISVIIPVYNSEKTIKETLDSVLNQTFPDFEVIVINDGSPDSSLDVISSIQDSRLKIFSYPNSGISASRNRGISHASGEFIAFLDHDDLWTPDKLESQLRALQENPQAAVAYSWTDLIDESSQFIKPYSHLSVTGNVHEKLLVSNFLKTASNPLIRKGALIQVGGFEQSICGPEDWDLFLRLAAHYHFVAVPRSQVLYRMITGSASTNVFRQEVESLKVIERAFNQAPKSLQHLKKRTLVNLYKYLTFQSLELPSGRQSGIAAIRCLWQAVRIEPSLLRQRTMLIALFKIAVVVLLPSRQSKALLKIAKQLNK